MPRTSLAIAVLISCGLGATAIAAQIPAKPAKPVVIVAKSLDKSEARQAVTAVGVQAINDATAAAVIGALQTRFPERDVEFKMGAIQSRRVSLRDIALDGAGQIRLEGTDSWMPIRFDALFDSDTQTVGSPSIIITRTLNTASDAGVDIARLDKAVDRKLDAEFQSQAVTFDLGAVSLIGGDKRHAVVDGNGIADFGAEGQAEVTLQGVYDRTEQRWLSVDYQLGGEPSVVLGKAVAAR